MTDRQVIVIERVPDKPPYIGANGHWFLFNPTTKQWVDTGDKAVAIDGKDGVSVHIVSGIYREPGSAKPLPDLPDVSTVPDGYAYVVDDEDIPGQYDLYYKGVGSTVWTVIDNWGGIPGQKGDTGNGVSQTAVSYATSAGGTVIPATGWTEAIPEVAANGFLWTRTTMSFTDGTSQTFYTVSQSIKGDKGDMGGKDVFASLGADGRVLPSQLPPKPLLLSVPPKLTVTLGNTVRQRIPYALLPEGVKPNIVFQCFDLEAIRFSGDGSFTAKAVGTSEVWVTPTENTDERKVVTVEVVAPGIILAGDGAMLLMGADAVFLT